MIEETLTVNISILFLKLFKQQVNLHTNESFIIIQFSGYL